MNSAQTPNEHATPVPNLSKVDLKIEVVIIAVADVDRAKGFCQNAAKEGALYVKSACQ